MSYLYTALHWATEQFSMLALFYSFVIDIFLIQKTGPHQHPSLCNAHQSYEQLGPGEQTAAFSSVSYCCPYRIANQGLCHQLKLSVKTLNANELSSSVDPERAF